MSKIELGEKPISVNWHFWPWCNMKCQFCFSRFENQKEILPKEKALLVPGLLKNAGTEKITLVGGEPMLCPYIDELLIESKKQGLVTKIVSNGTNITKEFLEKNHSYIDILSLSIDSSYERIERLLGRGFGNYVHRIKSIAKLIQEYNISFQLNTVVTKFTWQEDMHKLINELQPTRWKIFQILPVKRENDGRVDSLVITPSEYKTFCEKHSDIPQAIFEDNELMKGSYIMLDPVGKFFHNTTGKIEYSKSIFDIGVLPAFQQILWDNKKFLARKGIYNWKSKGNRI